MCIWITSGVSYTPRRTGTGGIGRIGPVRPISPVPVRRWDWGMRKNKKKEGKRSIASHRVRMEGLGRLAMDVIVYITSGAIAAVLKLWYAYHKWYVSSHSWYMPFLHVPHPQSIRRGEKLLETLFNVTFLEHLNCINIFTCFCCLMSPIGESNFAEWGFNISTLIVLKIVETHSHQQEISLTHLPRVGLSR